jgi:hypothetical protein
MAKLRLLAGSWRYRHKNEDKEVVTDRYTRGDVVEVSDAEAKKLLAENSLGRKNFVKADSEDDPFREGADDEDDEDGLPNEAVIQTSQEGKPAGSSMPRTATSATKKA